MSTISLPSLHLWFFQFHLKYYRMLKHHENYLQHKWSRYKGPAVRISKLCSMWGTAGDGWSCLTRTTGVTVKEMACYNSKNNHIQCSVHALCIYYTTLPVAGHICHKLDTVNRLTVFNRMMSQGRKTIQKSLSCTRPFADPIKVKEKALIELIRHRNATSEYFKKLNEPVLYICSHIFIYLMKIF